MSASVQMVKAKRLPADPFLTILADEPTVVVGMAGGFGIRDCLSAKETTVLDRFLILIDLVGHADQYFFP